MMPLTLSGSVIVGIGSPHLREPTWLGHGKPTLSAASMMSDALFPYASSIRPIAADPVRGPVGAALFTGPWT